MLYHHGILHSISGSVQTEYRKDFYELLCSPEEDVHLIDFNDQGIHECFCTDDYRDMDHLNQRGAEKLSTMLAAGI